MRSPSSKAIRTLQSGLWKKKTTRFMPRPVLRKTGVCWCTLIPTMPLLMAKSTAGWFPRMILPSGGKCCSIPTSKCLCKWEARPKQAFFPQAAAFCKMSSTFSRLRVPQVKNIIARTFLKRCQRTRGPDCWLSAFQCLRVLPAWKENGPARWPIFCIQISPSRISSLYLRCDRAPMEPSRARQIWTGRWPWVERKVDSKM